MKNKKTIIGLFLLNILIPVFILCDIYYVGIFCKPRQFTAYLLSVCPILLPALYVIGVILYYKNRERTKGVRYVFRITTAFNILIASSLIYSYCKTRNFVETEAQAKATQDSLQNVIDSMYTNLENEINSPKADTSEMKTR